VTTTKCMNYAGCFLFFLWLLMVFALLYALILPRESSGAPAPLPKRKPPARPGNPYSIQGVWSVGCFTYYFYPDGTMEAFSSYSHWEGRWSYYDGYAIHTNEKSHTGQTYRRYTILLEDIRKIRPLFSSEKSLGQGVK
jgi:hypothetical protein